MQQNLELREAHQRSLTEMEELRKFQSSTFEANGIAERAVRRIKEGTSAVLLQSGLDEKWWADSMECCCYLRHVQDHLADGKTPFERRFGEPLKGPIIPSGVNIIRFHRDIKQDFINLARKYHLVSFLWYELIAGRIWKGDILIANLEDLEKLDASEILSSMNQRERSIDITRGTRIHMPQLQLVQKNCQEETTNSENLRSEDLSGIFQGKPGEPQPTESKDDAEARADFWSIQGDFVCRHHNELRVQLYAPKEETFPLPLKYVDVTRSTY